MKLPRRAESIFRKTHWTRVIWEQWVVQVETSMRVEPSDLVNYFVSSIAYIHIPLSVSPNQRSLASYQHFRNTTVPLKVQAYTIPSARVSFPTSCSQSTREASAQTSSYSTETVGFRSRRFPLEVLSRDTSFGASSFVVWRAQCRRT